MIHLVDFSQYFIAEDVLFTFMHIESICERIYRCRVDPY